MKKSLLLIALSFLLLSACNKIPESAELAVDVPEALFGVWERQATYVNGELEHETSATLEISPDLYSSKATFCTTSGVAAAVDDSLTVTMTDSDCPSALSLPFTITYVYELSDGADELDLRVQGVRENYLRQE